MNHLPQAVDDMIKREGGYKPHEVSKDTGGFTFAGIARNYWPNWEGWPFVDAGEYETPRVKRLVFEFYGANFWRPLGADGIESFVVASTIFDFGVNAGTGTSAKLAQEAVGATPDGKIGPKTLAAINDVNEDIFLLRFALHKVDRYADIIRRNQSQAKFLRGWINRTLEQAPFKP